MRWPSSSIGILLATIVLASTSASAAAEHHQVLYATAGGMAVSSTEGYTVGFVTGALDPVPLAGQAEARIVATDVASTNPLVRYQVTVSVLIGCDIFCTYDIEVLSEGTFCKQTTIALPAGATDVRLYVAGTFTMAEALITEPICGPEMDFATSGVIDVWLA